LINEFWQDVAAGIKNEAAKYNIPGRCAGPQRRSLRSVEQLNLAQTILSQNRRVVSFTPSPIQPGPGDPAAKEA